MPCGEPLISLAGFAAREAPADDEEMRSEEEPASVKLILRDKEGTVGSGPIADIGERGQLRCGSARDGKKVEVDKEMKGYTRFNTPCWCSASLSRRIFTVRILIDIISMQIM